jgi:hypothetical protein
MWNIRRKKFDFARFSRSLTIKKVWNGNWFFLSAGKERISCQFPFAQK